MKVTVLQENFSRIALTSAKFSATRVQLPILSNVLLKTKGNKLTAVATNLENSIVIDCGAKVETEGEISVPAKTLSEIISNLPKSQIEIESKEEKLIIRCEKYKTELLGMNSADFPSVSDKIDKKHLVFDANLLNEALGKVLFSVSNDETRPVLTGVLFIIKPGKTYFVTTDGFRLSQKLFSGLKGDNKAKDEQRIIIPKNTLFELAKLISDQKEVFISFNDKENQIVFSLGDSILSSRIIQGEFPDFERIIPKSPTLEIEVDRDELQKAIKLSSVFARDASNIIKFKITKDNIVISAESAQSGNQTVRVEAKTVFESESGEDGFTIAYNYRFIDDWLNVVEADLVKIKFTDPNTAGLFQDPKDKDYMHIIMPVRITT